MQKISGMNEAKSMNFDLEIAGQAASTPNPNALAAAASSPVLARIPAKTQGSLLRMFADPHLLEKDERAELVQGLRECVLANPDVSELRVLYGMALCVDFKVQDAIEELCEGVRLAPDSFIAHLKMGELWMRLRVMTKAEAYTRQSGLLAQNRAQAELARRQAAKIREIKQHGIERGGYKGPLTMLGRLRRLLTPKVALAREGPAQVS
jgi:hypothetical protein